MIWLIYSFKNFILLFYLFINGFDGIEVNVKLEDLRIGQ